MGSGGAVSGVESEFRLTYSTSLQPHNHLSACVRGDTDTSDPNQECTMWRPGGLESHVFARHSRASKGSRDIKSHEELPPQTQGVDSGSSLSLKEMETIL